MARRAPNRLPPGQTLPGRGIAARPGNFSRRAHMARDRDNDDVKVSDEALDEFVALYKDEFKEDLTRAEASEMVHRLLMLYELLSQKLPDGESAPASISPQRPGESRT